ncbi:MULTISPECIES: hypothetical protein [Rhizobium]|uniref:Lipoyl-binding domain-containing protein n=1 Tax=Rhizobium favelukesii TaxID=348824 RepID=W6RRW8_9HYPH|nr:MULTISPECIES: hypothetical protein [Rhizobium]MCS0463175.1 hypothetical protein [Rhizobium favelukesii]UFS79345.1 hypothetical protein LPB79_07075 [Rhizobium sp. T136]CDM62890.1 hypothetical protein LPU83_pLPU83d_1520 [Rhizobium favelukesii]
MKSRVKQCRIPIFSELETLESISECLAINGVETIEITTLDGSVRITSSGGIRKHQEQAAGPATPALLSQTVIARAPIAGVFLPAHPDHTANEISSGDSVEAGQLVGFVRVGPVLVAVRAEGRAEVAKLDQNGGSLVGYGDVLICHRGA